MKLDEAEKLAENLMNQSWGGQPSLISQGWTFCWMRRKVVFGMCNYTKKQISLSISYVELNDFELVNDTIRHEIAHGYSQGSGHGAAWRRLCRICGANPQRCKSWDVVKADHKFEIVCGTCNKVVKKYFRRPTRQLSSCYHSSCGKGSILTLKKAG